MASSRLLKKFPRHLRYHQCSYALPVVDGFLDQPEEFIHEAKKDMLEHFVDADQSVDYTLVELHVFTKLPARE